MYFYNGKGVYISDGMEVLQTKNAKDTDDNYYAFTQENRSAERAAFSQHAISAEEVEACRDQLYILLKSSYLKQNTWQKLRFKYLHVLL